MKTVYTIVKMVCVVALTLGSLIVMYRFDQQFKQLTATTQVAVTQTNDKLVPLAISLNHAVQDLDSTILDTRRTVLIAGGTLNLVRDTLKKEQASAKASIESSQALIKNSNALVTNSSVLIETANRSLQQVTEDVDKALSPMPVLLNQTTKDLAVLEKSEEELTPLIKNTSDTMEHISGITADTQYEVHKFVHPPPAPWYDKYIIDPAKFGLHMLTIPLR